MKFSRRKALQEHRKMWNWIADEIERTGLPVGKYEYLKDSPYRTNLTADCFLCEYTRDTYGGKCNNCPVIWYKNDDKFKASVYTPCIEPKSPYYKFLMNDIRGVTYEEWVTSRVKYAREVANLPERPGSLKKFLNELFSRGE